MEEVVWPKSYRYSHRYRRMRNRTKLRRLYYWLRELNSHIPPWND